MKGGMILVDILLALFLATVFTAIITDSSMGARQIFDRARVRQGILDAFELSSSLASSSSRPFGNDRTEDDIASFTKVRARDMASPGQKIIDSAGTPLCASDFSNSDLSRPIDSSRISITPIMLPIDPLLPLTDLEVRDGIAYVSDDSSKASDPDLFVIDFRDENAPKVLSSIDTGPGIADIALAGDHIYAAAASTAAQLHVIRIDSLSSLALEKKYRLPPPYATATEPVGSSVFFDRNEVYLGTEKWDGNEFSVIDVSVPAQPTIVGGFETNSKVNDIFVRDGLAYVADSDQDQLRIIDVRKPEMPALAYAFAPSGWVRQEGETLSYFEDSLGLGRTSGGFNIINDHEAFTWAAASSSDAFLSSPITVGAYHSVDISGGVYGMVADRSHVYLATRQVNKEFQIFDRSLSTSTATSYSLPVAPQTLTCDGDHLYILAATAPVIYDISFH